ncbi:MAG: response regulator [Nitrospirales bacterium]|nr:response regulator [Nitrospirales bacterium]
MDGDVEILLVEDNHADIRLTQEAFKEAKIRNNLSVVQDGASAVEFIQQRGPYQRAPRPDLILLDLNLPKMDGREVLEFLKSGSDTKHIPVVVLTTSDDEEDILRSYKLHANAYLVKPIDMMQFIKMIHSLEGFWLSVVKLPPKTRRS